MGLEKHVTSAVEAREAMPLEEAVVLVQRAQPPAVSGDPALREIVTLGRPPDRVGAVKGAPPVQPCGPGAALAPLAA